MKAGRRRRSADEAEREILAAAERFLRERPMRELTVDAVMAETGLSRTSFYNYFRDRHELVLHLTAEVDDALEDAAESFAATGRFGADSLQNALRRLVDAHTQHGAIIRAIADASCDDREVELAYHARIERLIDAAASGIRGQMRRGVVSGLNPQRTAAALMWMTERYLGDCFGPRRQMSARTAAAVLTDIWMRVLYLQMP